ncbi:MAG: hypothetical protein JWM11_70, partial [Planctomycetaceae bacterium]|nr:hypothetical protein [Planctomycetaceae bacterium]
CGAIVSALPGPTSKVDMPTDRQRGRPVHLELPPGGSAANPVPETLSGTTLRVVLSEPGA